MILDVLLHRKLFTGSISTVDSPHWKLYLSNRKYVYVIGNVDRWLDVYEWCYRRKGCNFLFIGVLVVGKYPEVFEAAL